MFAFIIGEFYSTSKVRGFCGILSLPSSIPLALSKSTSCMSRLNSPPPKKSSHSLSGSVASSGVDVPFLTSSRSDNGEKLFSFDYLKKFLPR